jgi:protein transport protein SEC61 subunit beta
MAGTSTGGASTIVPRAGRTGTGAPAAARDSVGPRRRTAGRPSSSNSKQQATSFYTDDSPGLKISPVVVIGMSIGFIVFVTVLHVFGKLYS